MAKLNLRRSQNISGDFYVDTSCIDCDTCRWMAPQTFTEISGQSAVYHQPQTPEEQLTALQALLSCPTSSIGTVAKPANIQTAHSSFPIPIDDNVYHCGYHSEKSFAAASYLIQLPTGNILIDSPRFNPPLVKQLAAMGGVKYMYLTHRDDIADHQKFTQHFQCQRILHEDDINAETQNVEVILKGSEVFELSPDILIIPVPGHTKGHTVLLYKNKFLFTGDHLAWSKEYQQLIAFHDFCWYSFHEQIQSMHKLTKYKFEWVLPGHGRRYHADMETMQLQMQKCLELMKQSEQ